MTNNITQSVKEAYPDLSGKEIDKLIDSILEFVAEKISAGEDIASVKKNDNGDLHLSVLQMKPARTGVDFSDEIEKHSSRTREQVTFRINPPKLLTIDGFINLVNHQAKAIDFVYFLLYYVAHGSRAEVRALCDHIASTVDKDSLQRTDFYNVLKSAKGINLRMASVHYGSPITIDLLGIGHIIEASRDLIKDVSWRANHEKKLAQLERKNKSVEIEKAKVEITAQKLALEKVSTEIALQKIEILERLSDLPLSENEKELVISAMIPKLLALADKKSSLLLESTTGSHDKKPG